MAVQRRELTTDDICALHDREILTRDEARDLLGITAAGDVAPVRVDDLARQLRDLLASQSRWVDPAFTRALDRMAAL